MYVICFVIVWFIDVNDDILIFKFEEYFVRVFEEIFGGFNVIIVKVDDRDIG